MLRIAIFGIVTSLCVFVLRQHEKGIGAVLLLSGSLVIFLSSVEYLETFWDVLEGIRKTIQIDPVYTKILWKIVGIAYVCQFTSGICQDLGSQTLGKQVENAGKLSVLIISIPVIQGVIDTLQELLQL